MSLMSTVILLPRGVRFWVEVTQGVILEPSNPFSARSWCGNGQEIDALPWYEQQSDLSDTSKVWVLDGDGEESAHELAACRLDMRIGHSLAVIYGAAEGIREGQLLGAWNLTTGKTGFNNDARLERLSQMGFLFERRFLKKRLNLGALLGIGLGGASSIATNNELSLLVIGASAGILTAVVVAAAQAIVRLLWAKQMVPELNRRALYVLLSQGVFPEKQ